MMKNLNLLTKRIMSIISKILIYQLIRYLKYVTIIIIQRFISLRIKKNKVRLQYVVNKIDRDEDINEQYKEFVREFRYINNNAKILYDYQTYKNLVLDRINNEEVSTSNDDSFIKEVGKNLLKT